MMKRTLMSILLGLFVLGGVSTASAQLTAANDGPIVYGHHHLNVTDVAAHKRFWGDALGGTVMPLGNREIFKFPNVLVFLREQVPTGGTKGTTVNHIGFRIPSVRKMVDKVRAAGFPVVTRAELPPSLEVTDGLARIENQDTYIAMVMGPDDTKVELFEDRSMSIPIALHHIHFASQNVDEMKAWYVEMFGAEPGMRGSFQAADLPGVNLTWSPSAESLTGTQGRVLDHIGFEVENLEEFCKKLERMGITFDRPYTKLAGRDLAIAFLTDPFGTYIELTEGLDKY